MTYVLSRQFSNLFATKEPATIRHNSFSPLLSSSSVFQQRPCHRTLRLCPCELHQTRQGEMIDTSPSIELRQRATTWSPRQSITLTSDQNDSASNNLDQVCSRCRIAIMIFFIEMPFVIQGAIICDASFITLGSNKPRC